jgi:ABC-type phosphate/phosphonate transport system substrate-binding protein
MAWPRASIVAGTLGLLALVASVPARGQPPMAFIGVALDKDSRLADRKLADYLFQKTGRRFSLEDLEYERVVDRLVNWRREDGHFVARATPYVYVAAEMLGAQLDLLATYTSAATGGTIYHSYFVVGRQHFSSQPTLYDLERFLAGRTTPARFVYHNQFSTSSYFLPSLYFRSRKIFNMPEATESLVAISAVRVPEASSSALVEMVARGEADLAAVWDDTKARFDRVSPPNPAGRRVYFIQLPTALPNDLLVCSSGLDPETKNRLRDAVEAMTPTQIATGDFRSWTGITAATDTRLALADLRWLARERPYPATVDIRVAPGSDGGRAAVLAEAARQAVRLAGTEFVLHDADFHEHIDFVWTVEPIHDGAGSLRSAIPGSDVPEQVFRISFHDHEDLTKRLVSIITSRLHRIRYVWPYSSTRPLVVRDLALPLQPGSAVKMQRILWIDPERNKFRGGPVLDARVRAAGFYRYELEHADSGQGGEGGLQLDAMSNASYRVILLRTTEERLLFRLLTIALVALAVLAGAAASWDLFRSRRAVAMVGLPVEDR